MNQNVIDITVIAKDLASKTFKSIGDSAKDLGSKLGSHLKKGIDQLKNFGLAAGAAGAALGLFGLKAAADMQSMGVALKTAFQGDAEAAKAAQDQITEFAAKTPFQLEEVLGSFIKLKNYGLEPSERALKAYGDTASAMGKNLDQMVEAVADATTGEFERLKEFGVRASKEGDNIKFTFRGIETTIKNDSKAIQEYLLELGETNFAGGMEAQSKTLNGVLSTLKDNFSIAMGKILTDTGVLDLVTRLVQGLSDKIVEVMPVIVEFSKNAIEYAKQKFDELWPTIESVIGFLKGLMETLFPTEESFKTFIETAAILTAGLIAASVAFGILTSPITAIGLAIGALALIWAHFGDDIKRIMQSVIDFLEGAWNFIKEIFKGGVDFAVNLVSGGFNQMKNIVEGTVGAIVSVINTIKGAVESALGALRSLSQAEEARKSARELAESSAPFTSSQGFQESIAPRKKFLGLFAGGADFIVPQGFPKDDFMMGVQTGERVQVTPANEVSKGDNDKKVTIENVNINNNSDFQAFIQMLNVMI